MELKFKLVFKQGVKTVATVEGVRPAIPTLTIGDLVDKVPETEQFLEKLTGLRVHIEQVN